METETFTTPDPTPEEQMRKRAEQCAAAINAACEAFRCRIVPFIGAPEPVGANGTKLMLTASYAIVPIADQ